MVTRPPVLLYWDSSAILSLVALHPRRGEAIAWSRARSVHLLSTLAWAEVNAGLARLRRESGSTEVVQSARDALDRVPWHRLPDPPEWEVITSLAATWPLRGADLWHLALAKTLQQERPELRLLSFDDRLSKAAAGEGLAATTPT